MIRVPRLTSEAIALANLDAEIGGLVRRVETDLRPVDSVELVDHLLTRAAVAGNPRDAAAADAWSASAALIAPDVGAVRLSRARCLAYFHRFAEAGSELEVAESNGVPEWDLLPEQISLKHASDHTHEAVKLCEQAVSQRHDSSSLGQLACLYAVAGAHPSAETTFAAAISAYKSVSPIGFAGLCCNWGHAMEHSNDREAAVSGYLAAATAMPNHVRARRALDHLLATG